ncbi:phage virion morphogenesis protein [Nitrosomonas halophila]|uniref:Phage virion morphogenesis (Putative tail completion) protein n=1 Tax=Nitrosomonas halophila TaxID=44576 RepID=A0A1H3FDS2_9PROT|nr:phage virion morphogenesis protein [Nitrosomonas halophila]SDX88314.1 phage virion morphogenesis (putative tail completion) protein [Nitrosomonas halophila]
MRIRLEVDDRQLQDALSRLMALGSNPARMLGAIAFYGENATRRRFQEQAGPDRQPWQPSLRARLHGGKTLVQDRHLLDSIVSRADSAAAEWGSNKIYAAIHQFGGEIRPRSAQSLFFRLADGSARRVKKVVIPARPYLGIDTDDRENILDIINQHIERTIK